MIMVVEEVYMNEFNEGIEICRCAGRLTRSLNRERRVGP